MLIVTMTETPDVTWVQVFSDKVCNVCIIFLDRSNEKPPSGAKMCGEENEADQKSTHSHVFQLSIITEYTSF